jgi:hypothetical protein
MALSRLGNDFHGPLAATFTAEIAESNRTSSPSGFESVHYDWIVVQYLFYSFLIYGLLYHKFEVCMAYLQCLPESNVLKMADISSLVKARVLDAQPLLLGPKRKSSRQV